MTGPLRALTIRPLPAWATSAGYETVENRSRPSHHRGEIAIHAAARWHQADVDDPRIARAAADWGTRHGPWPSVGALAVLAGHPNAVPAGAIVAVTTLVGCHQATPDCCGPWGDLEYNGRPAWHLLWGPMQPLAEPVPCRGQQAVPWPVPADVAALVRAQLQAAA